MGCSMNVSQDNSECVMGIGPNNKMSGEEICHYPNNQVTSKDVCHGPNKQVMVMMSHNNMSYAQS